MFSAHKLRTFLLQLRNIIDLWVSVLNLIAIGFKTRFFKANISIGFFPRDRDRYIKLFPKDRTKIWRLRAVSPLVISIVKSISPGEVVISADFLDSCNESLANSLESLKFKVFIWNDELEVIRVQKQTGIHSLSCIGFFSCTRKSFGSDIQFEVPNFLPDENHRIPETSPTLCFAGQVDPAKYDSIILADENLRNISLSLDVEIRKTSPTKLFETYSNTYFDVSVEEFVMLRHKAINTWRYNLLRLLSEEIKGSLVLFGKDFVDNEDFKLSDVRKDSANFPEEYAKHRVNLDLGSQCGDEYLYPRSLEIYSVNPKSLFVYERGDSSPRIPATYWKNLDELVQTIKKVGITS